MNIIQQNEEKINGVLETFDRNCNNSEVMILESRIKIVENRGRASHVRKTTEKFLLWLFREMSTEY